MATQPDTSQIALPYVVEERDPRPNPAKRKAVAIARKPPEREGAIAHPQQGTRVIA